jgi:hypothetical protein
LSAARCIEAALVSVQMKTELLSKAAFAVAALLLSATAAAQVECWAPQEAMDKVLDKRFAVQLGWIQRAFQIVRKNQAFMSPPEPVRMRSTLAAGPYYPSGARLLVRAYPEKSTVGIQIWTGTCDVIPQAERVAASIGQIDVFFNISAEELMRLTGGQPKFEGMVGGHPRYNGFTYISRDGRLPWIPQTLGDRIDAVIAKRERALADWRKQLANATPPDAARMAQAIETIRKTDPAGAEKLRASLEETEHELRYKQQEVYPRTTAQYEKELADARRYRTEFNADALAQPAVWTDTDGAGQRRLEQRIQELNALSPEQQEQIRSGAQTSTAVRNAHRDKIAPLLSDAQAEFELAYLKPGRAEQAIAYKADPNFPDMRQPDRLQLIMLLFSEDPRKQRGPWMRAAKAEFDFAALAAMLD